MLYSFQKDFGLASWLLLPPLAHPEVTVNIRRQNFTTFVFSHLNVSACLLKYILGLREHVHWLFQTTQQHQGLLMPILFPASVLSVKSPAKGNKAG